MTWPDVLRWAAVVGWATLMGLTVATLVAYFRAQALERRMGILRAAGLLPSHVVSLGLILAGFATEAVLVNVSRLGEPIGPVNIINPVLFGVACHGMWLVARFEHRRWVNLRRQVRPTLPSDQRKGG